MSAADFSQSATSNPAGLPKAGLLAAIRQNNMQPGISLALFIATGALCFQKGWNKEDYILHCLTVADLTNTDPRMSEAEKIVGILHDVVEDSDWTFDDLKAVGFSDEIVEGVRSVTKQKGEKYFDAIRRCSKNPIGRAVKRRDNDHNMRLTRGPFVAGVKQKYHYNISWHYLSAVDAGKIAPDTPIWDFLQMGEFRNLMNRKNYHYIAQQTSEAPSAPVLMMYGQPRLDLKHP